MSPDRDPLGLVGTTLAEKYAIESVVGVGGFAVVYRATHTLWKRTVAVKVFNALAVAAPEHRQALLDDFIQEGALLAELSERSTAICQARDIGMLTSARGQMIPYMVLEWLEGRSLEAVLEAERAAGKPLRSLAETVRFLDPVAEALALAHSKGVAHRDVKPANVFVLEDTSGAAIGVKLLDFGIAKVVQDAQKMGFGKTSGEVTSFTPLYGAPEQFDRRWGATGPWTDVFALALVASEVASGREPMMGDDLVQLAFAAANPTSRPTPRALGVTTGDDVEAVFQKAVAVKTEERFKSVGEFWSALRQTVLGDATSSERTPRSGSASWDGTPLEATQRPSNPAFAPTEEPAQSRAKSVPEPTSPQGTTMPDAGMVKAKSSGKPLLIAAAAVVGLAAIGAVALTRGKASQPAPVTSASAVPSVPSASAAPSSLAGPVDPSKADVSGGKCPAGMAFIPGGDFFMGSDDSAAEKDEKPAHRVRLSPFCLDLTEVTVEAYRACSDRSACLRAGKENRWPGITPAQKKLYDPLCNENDPVARAKHPVNCVDHEQAVAYCRERGARLPTEAEWELAARGPDQRLYPWGDEHPDGTRLNACGKECMAWKAAHPDPSDDAPASMYEDDDGFPNTSPVGSFPKGASRYGLLDIVGNVWEWTWDWYGPYAVKGNDPQNDPTGPAKGRSRVLRGGAWNGADKSWVKPAYRFAAAPDSRVYAYGFRCAQPAKAP